MRFIQKFLMANTSCKNSDESVEKHQSNETFYRDLAFVKDLN